MILSITQEDLDRGRRGNPSFHPLVLAIGRETGQSWTYEAGWLYHPLAHRSRVPEELQGFCYAWQMGGTVHPRTLEIDLPDLVGGYEPQIGETRPEDQPPPPKPRKETKKAKMLRELNEKAYQEGSR